MDLRIYLLVAALISLSAATDTTKRNSSDQVETRGEFNTNVDKIKDWMMSRALTSILNTTLDKRTDHYFDSFSYCSRSVIGQGDNVTKEDVRSKYTEGQFLVKTLLVMKCVAVTDAVTIPYNVFQDVKQSLVEVRREFSWSKVVQKLMMIPFVVVRSIVAQPSRALNNVLGVIIGSILTYFSVYA